MAGITLHTIAKEVSLLGNDKSDINIPKYILIGKEAISELNTRGFMPIKNVALDIDGSTNSAKLPDDYLKYTKVGICICGRILELDYDSTICIREKKDNFCKEDTNIQSLSNDCGCLENERIPTEYGTTHYNWSNVCHNGTYLNPIYTIPAYKSTGYFKIQNGRIYLNSVCANGTVVMQYKSTGESEVGQTEIPLELKEVVKSYITWKNAFYEKNTRIGIVQLYEMEYKRKKDLLAKESVLKSVLDMLKVEMSYRSTSNLGI